MELDKNSKDYEILKKTVFAEARGESKEGQRAVAWVIKNRANQGTKYSKDGTIAGVCLKPYQFSCWNQDEKHLIEQGIKKERHVYDAMDEWLPKVYKSPDPTGGADHYFCPSKIPTPDWVKNCEFKGEIGNHKFYKAKC